MSTPQLWILVGGNGAGKSTFYEKYLQPKGLPFVNADIIAREYFLENAESRSLEAAKMAESLRYHLLEEKISFCFETVFSHESKIDFIGDAKAAGFEVIMIFIHLNNAELNKARVWQRVDSGGHSVPESLIEPRIERLLGHVKKVVTLGLADQIHIVDNSSYQQPYIRLVRIKKGAITYLVDSPPAWLVDLLEMA